MTEAEWLACRDPRPMLDVLAGQSGLRKWRLVAIESCMQVHWLTISTIRSSKK